MSRLKVLSNKSYFIILRIFPPSIIRRSTDVVANALYHKYSGFKDGISAFRPEHDKNHQLGDNACFVI